MEYADLAFKEFKAQNSSPELQAKALYRKVVGNAGSCSLGFRFFSTIIVATIGVRLQGSALLAFGRPELAVPTFQHALKLSGGSATISAGFSQALHDIPQQWLVEVRFRSISSELLRMLSPAQHV